MNKPITPPAPSQPATASEAVAKPHDAAPQPVQLLLPRPLLVMAWVMELTWCGAHRHDPLTAEYAGNHACLFLLTVWDIIAAVLDVYRWLGTHLPRGRAGR